jgi:hypothetical protein
MILFDHGLRPQAAQIAGADLDIEYKSGTVFEAESLELAMRLQAGNGSYSLRYPAQIGSRMCCTDSRSFKDVAPAVSVRENRRVFEIGRGSNPNWHQPTDLFATYDDDDFRLGFDAVRMTVGTVGELAGARRSVEVRFR